MWSYVDQLNISVLADGVTTDDPHEVTAGMVADFKKIRRAAGLSEELTVVETAMAQIVAQTMGMPIEDVTVATACAR